MEPPVQKTVTVVEGEFFADRDGPKRLDPDSAARHLRLAVGLTGVVDIPGDIPGGPAIDIMFLIEFEYRNTGIAAAALPL